MLKIFAALGLLLGLGPAPVSIDATDVRPATVDAFGRYIQRVESDIDARVGGRQPFLWADDSPARRARVRGGEVVTARTAGSKPVEVPDGLVHDWIGAVFIPGVGLRDTIAFLQDYDEHKRSYREVIDSKLLSRDGEHFVVFLRLQKKKVITVVLDTLHDARYFPLDATRWHSRSRSTRIAEVQNPGAPDEHEMPVGGGHGFLWGLNSYWRFVERDGGVFVECEAVSLSRAIPWGLGWLIGPIVNDLPRESLADTLAATRTALVARAAALPR
jgi:hypothetical protein